MYSHPHPSPHSATVQNGSDSESDMHSPIVDTHNRPPSNEGSPSYVISSSSNAAATSNSNLNLNLNSSPTTSTSTSAAISPNSPLMGVSSVKQGGLHPQKQGCVGAKHLDPQGPNRKKSVGMTRIRQRRDTEQVGVGVGGGGGGGNVAEMGRVEESSQESGGEKRAASKKTPFKRGKEKGGKNRGNNITKGAIVLTEGELLELQEVIIVTY